MILCYSSSNLLRQSAPQKKKVNIELPYDPAIPFIDIYIPKRTEGNDLKRYLYTHVHNIIHSSQKMETM